MATEITDCGKQIQNVVCLSFMDGVMTPHAPKQGVMILRKDPNQQRTDPINKY